MNDSSKNSQSNKGRSGKGGNRRHRSGSKNNQRKQSKAQSGDRNRTPKKNQNRNRNRDHSKKSKIKLDPIFRNYERLCDALTKARKDYLDKFHHHDRRVKQKYEKLYFTAMKKLRDYESSLSSDEKERYQKLYPDHEFDTTYSQNHELSTEGEVLVNDTDIEDPHFLESQKESDYKEDEEESVGSIDDYYAYKGIDPEEIKRERLAKENNT
ncbi:MAG: hypothetical protein ACPGJV_02425 [Bacteriovoracaceae bacterium]